ncbi:MAG: OadG family protein [Anaerolineae bacterium]
MSELLSQALWYTLIGMGMTFAAIGALVLGMYLLTYLFPERKEEKGEVEVPAPPPDAVPGKEAARAVERRRLAAIAAATVAVAQASKAPTLEEGAGSAMDQWRSFVRGQQLTHRIPRTGYKRR